MTRDEFLEMRVKEQTSDLKGMDQCVNNNLC